MKEQDFYPGYRERLESKLRHKNTQISRTERLLQSLPANRNRPLRPSCRRPISDREEIQAELDQLNRALADFKADTSPSEANPEGALVSDRTLPTLSELENLAHQAGLILRSGYGQKHQVQHKGVIDLVTEIDHRSEDLLITAIRQRFPSHRIITEESGTLSGDSEYIWYIDPAGWHGQLRPRYAHLLCLDRLRHQPGRCCWG